MKMAKKIMSMVLAVAIILSVCLVGGFVVSAATVIDDGNYLLNGSFETANNVWNQVSQKSGNIGFTNMQLGHGQHATLVDDWKYCEHWNKQNMNDGNGEVSIPEKYIYADHSTDGHTGDFSLKLKNAGTTETYTESSARIYPAQVVGGNAAAFESGTYRFSVWVKGNAAGAYIRYTDAAGTTNTVNISTIREDSWTQVVIDDIEGFGTTTNDDDGTILNLYIYYCTSNTATEILLDDAVLEDMPSNSNLILESGFENSEGATTTLSNQYWNIFNNTWVQQTWSPSNFQVSATDDSHTGDYAYRCIISASSSSSVTCRLYIAAENGGAASNIDTSRITAGRYRLSVWVKGNATGSYLYYGDTKVYVPASAATEWKQLIIDGITVDDSGLATAGDGTGHDRKRYSGFGFAVVGTVAEIIIDDICLEAYDDNMFGNTSFESSGARDTGYTNYVANQTLVAGGWRDLSWGNPNKVSHVTDNVHSGSYALKYDFYQKKGEARICPEIANIPEIAETHTLPAGKYKLSVWVYGTKAVRFWMPGHTKNSWITPTEEWQKISYTVSYTEDTTLEIQESKSYKHIAVGIQEGSAGQYVILDDFSLERLDSVEDAAAQITGIPQPAKGAQTLTLPTVATNNDSISVSLAKSSNEAVIDADGNIYEPMVQTMVDITLKVSDGETEITLDPIGVLVHGKLDAKTRAVVESEIDALVANYKDSDTAEQIASIDEFMTYKSSYITTEYKNMFSQKKLVYSYDITLDYILDDRDIKKVVECLLIDSSADINDDGSTDIRDLVRIEKKVVEFHQYN